MGVFLWALLMCMSAIWFCVHDACAACCLHSIGWFGFYYVTSRGCVQGPSLWHRLPCECLETSCSSCVLSSPQLWSVRMALTELTQLLLISTSESPAITTDHQSGHSKALEHNWSTECKDLCRRLCSRFVETSRWLRPHSRIQLQLSANGLIKQVSRHPWYKSGFTFLLITNCLHSFLTENDRIIANK